METKIIRKMEGEFIVYSLYKNTFKDGDFNFNVIEFSKKHDLELSNDVFDTLRKANNYLKRYTSYCKEVKQ